MRSWRTSPLGSHSVRWLPALLGAAAALLLLDFLFAKKVLLTLVFACGLVLGVGALVLGRFQRIGSATLGFTLVLFLTLTVTYWAPALSAALSRRSFDSIEWRRSRGQGPGGSTRQAMVEDLISRKDLLGRTRAQVVELLGEDDTVAAARRFPEWDLIYWVGRDRAIGIDSEWLGIRLGPDSRVVEFSLVED